MNVATNKAQRSSKLIKTFESKIFTLFFETPAET